MAKTSGSVPEDSVHAPALTSEQIEAAVLFLLQGKENGWAATLSRPEKVKERRARCARVVKNEAYRIAEAPLNILGEAKRRNG